MALPNLEVRVTADTVDAESGLDRVGNAARQTSNSVDRMATVTRRAGQQMARAVNDNNRFGRSIQNASFQLGDFATQVGAGTSASIALGQQLPQLLGGFGVLGAVLGAVVAIGVPMVRVMGDMADQGRDMTTIFGELSPVARGVGDAIAFIRDVGVIAIEAVINNIDQLLITAGLAAAYFAGPLVASFVAARVAAFSLAGALGFLRTALIRTGIGALVVGAGYLVERFLALSRAAGGFGEAFDLVAQSVGLAFRRVGQEIRAFIFGMLADINEGIATVLNAAGLDALAARFQALAVEQDAVWTAATISAQRYAEQLQGINGQIAGLLESVEGQRISLRDLFGGGEGEEGEGANDAARQRLQTQLDQIRESQMTEQELLMTHLAQKKAILDEALAEELLARQEHAALTQSLEKETADKIIAIEDAKRATMLGQTASLFGALANLAQAGGKKTAGIAKAFGIAEAIINTYVGATNALSTVPFPANFAAAAAVIANGLASVATIASVNTSSGESGAGGGAGGRGTAPAPAAPAPLDVFIRGVGPSDMISGGQLSSLFDKLVEEAGDRGIRPVFAT